MLNEAIRLGDKLNIKQLDQKQSIEYPSKLLDIKEDMISIAMPIIKNQVVILDISSRYRVTFYTEKGLYACEGEVVRRYKVSNIYVAELKMIGKLSKVQRREYFRLHCILPMKYCVVPFREMTQLIKQINESNTAFGLTDLQKKLRAVGFLQDLDAKNGSEYIKFNQAIVTDISGGGMRFTTKDEIMVGHELYLIFSINQELDYFHLFGEIISSGQSTNGNNLYENRLKFTSISREERETIVRFVLNEERKLRQKEKGFN